MRVAAAVVVAAGLIAVILLVLELATDTDNPRNPPEIAVQFLQPYDSSFVNLWVRGCVGSGESLAFCRCAIDVYTDRLRPDEFETATAVAQSGGRLAELPENLRNAVKTVERECR